MELLTPGVERLAGINIDQITRSVLCAGRNADALAQIVDGLRAANCRGGRSASELPNSRPKELRVRLQKYMEPLVTLRASQSVDAEFFYSITEQTMRPHVLAAGGTWEEERRRKESAEDAICPGTSVILVGTVEAGILAVERSPSEIQLQTLYLLPSFQGLGVGSLLVSSLQQEASRRRIPLRLQVLKANPAKGFYEHLGFSIEEETEYFFHMQFAI